jgi:hypothetical protein
MDESFLQQLMILRLTFELLIPDPAQLLIENFILFHAHDDVLKDLGLHARLLESFPHSCHLFFPVEHQLVGFLALLLHGPLPALQEVDVLPPQLQHAQSAGCFLGSLVVVLPDGAQVLPHDGRLV